MIIPRQLRRRSDLLKQLQRYKGNGQASSQRAHAVIPSRARRRGTSQLVVINQAIARSFVVAATQDDKAREPSVRYIASTL
jgi:hypothetical protein